MLIFVFATDSRWAWPFPRTGCALRALTATVMPSNGQVKTSHATQVQIANVEQLESTSTLLGLFKEWDCSMREQEFAPGDVLALYADGVSRSQQPARKKASAA